MHMLDHAGGIIERRVEAFGEVVADKPSDIFKEKVSTFTDGDFTIVEILMKQPEKL